VCDTWVAMRSDRPHRSARTQAGAMTELRRVAGSQLDPRIVDAFLVVLSRSETFALHG
jgi:HD-GYP domain-containing protein (c-di-GMP phosphodiesterase class II)